MYSTVWGFFLTLFSLTLNLVVLFVSWSALWMHTSRPIGISFLRSFFTFFFKCISKCLTYSIVYGLCQQFKWWGLLITTVNVSCYFSSSLERKLFYLFPFLNFVNLLFSQMDFSLACLTYVNDICCTVQPWSFRN